MVRARRRSLGHRRSRSGRRSSRVTQRRVGLLLRGVGARLGTASGARADPSQRLGRGPARRPAFGSCQESRPDDPARPVSVRARARAAWIAAAWRTEVDSSVEQRRLGSHRPGRNRPTGFDRPAQIALRFGSRPISPASDRPLDQEREGRLAPLRQARRSALRTGRRAGGLRGGGRQGIEASRVAQSIFQTSRVLRPSGRILTADPINRPQDVGLDQLRGRATDLVPAPGVDHQDADPSASSWTSVGWKSRSSEAIRSSTFGLEAVPGPLGVNFDPRDFPEVEAGGQEMIRDSRARPIRASSTRQGQRGRGGRAAAGRSGPVRAWPSMTSWALP